MPLVSVIMNIRNGAGTLREALDSLMAQTFPDWELIAWDDCSTDESARIVSEYQDPRIGYFLSPEDTPLGRARDLAMRHARGEWLAFLDQDDIWTPNKLEKQLALAADKQIGLIYGRTLKFFPGGGLLDYDHPHEFRPLPQGDIFQELFTHSCFIAMSSAVLRRSAVEEIGRVPDAVQVIPDYFLYTSITARYQARAVQEVVCRYRVHPGNMSRTTGVRLQQENLWLVDHWAYRLTPQIAAQRRKRHSTYLALEEMRTPATFCQGVVRLLTRGSVGWLSSRPFALGFRAVRRRVRRPYWQTAGKRT
jgi:glycosyltransferase involved in cell wall biosynthesis